MGEYVASNATATLAVPYTCRCAFCGATIHGEEKITAEGHDFPGSYLAQIQSGGMILSEREQAVKNLSFELEYAGKRLAHYRETVSSGRQRAWESCYEPSFTMTDAIRRRREPHVYRKRQQLPGYADEFAGHLPRL